MQETDLDQPITTADEAESTSKTEEPEEIHYEDPSNIIKALDNLLAESGYRVDTTVDDDHQTDHGKEKRSKKFTRKFPKFEFTHKPIGQQFNEWTDDHYDDQEQKS
ncbi:hypothetical protein BLA29_013795 [Euroglyphus maynei]|uniref:Uncharacterized protein n=1 Tax=Euroglyphus maynei TaxID=6958 RepID=A0A1Y3AVP2_EURMA|nr:hypothetical protein BLA29_013795 [Euroglyphus maynei]